MAIAYNVMGRGGQHLPVQSAITADATNPPTQSSAAAATLIAGFNEVTVSGSDDDACLLPPCKIGHVVIVKNADSSQYIEIFPASGDTIDGGSADAHDAALGEGKSIIYIGTTATNWVSIEIN